MIANYAEPGRLNVMSDQDGRRLLHAPRDDPAIPAPDHRLSSGLAESPVSLIRGTRRDIRPEGLSDRPR